MVDVFLNSYKGYIKEVNDYMNATEKSKSKLNITFKETPMKLIMKRNDETVYDLNKPKYVLIDSLIESNKSKLLQERKSLRQMVLKYLNSDEETASISMISDKIDRISLLKSKMSKLLSRKNGHRLHNLISDLKNIESQVVKDVKKKDVKKDVKIEKLKTKMKEKLIEEKNTEELTEEDLKVFMFKSLKECMAHPSKKNNALSKDKLIAKMLENPKLKAKLPSSYRTKSKEELCRIIFPN